MTTGISWTDETWNPTVGCSKISEGCRNCYAIGQSYRNAAIGATMPNPGRLKYYEGLTEKRGDRVEWTGVVNFVPEALKIPLKWKKPRRIFVNSMSDLFHESVPFEWIDQAFAVMSLTAHHTYQILTKRPDRMLEYFSDLNDRTLKIMACLPRWIARDAAYAGKGLTDSLGEREYFLSLPNVWLGVTVENQQAANDRIPLLLQCPAALRFLSCEPLLESVDLGKSISDLDWVIVGGESGPGARNCNTEWMKSIVQECQQSEVPVFVKQLGAKPFSPYSPVDGASIRWPISDRKGAIVAEFPNYLQVQQFPQNQGDLP